MKHKATKTETENPTPTLQAGAKQASQEPVFDPQQERMLQQAEKDFPSKLGHFRKAYEGRSLRSAITAKCLDCDCGNTKAIRECAATGCPLWTQRPYQEAA